MSTPLPFRWSDGTFRETRAFLTDVVPSWSLQEQRRQHRTRARRTYQYTIVCTSPRHAARVDQLLAAGSLESVGCPAWPYSTRLTSDAASGQAILACPTGSRPFDAGQEVLIVRTPDEYEQRTIDAVGGSSITCGENLVGDWPAGTLVIPVHSGRLVDGLTIARPSARVSRIQLTLALDPLAVPESIGQPDDTPPDFAPIPDRGIEDTLTRPVILVDPAVAGAAHRTARRDEGRATQAYPLLLLGLDQVATVWDWYDAVLGALTPSWVPSWQADLVPAADVGPADTALVIEACDYTARSFPLAARRRLALLASTGGSVVARTVTNAVDNLDGTETLTLNAAAGVTLTPRHGLVSFRRLMVLEDDPVTLDWLTAGRARAALAFREEPYAVAAP